MQKTARLVERSRSALLRVLLVASFFVCLPSAVAVAQVAGSEDTAAKVEGKEGAAPSDTWGEKAPPKNYVKSKEPNKTGQAYNWIQMAWAGGFMVLVAGFMVWIVKRNTRDEDAS